MSASWRWTVCGLLFLATLLNYLDRQTLSIAAPLIREEMKLDLAQIGILFSVFYWSYAAAQLVAGLVIDRVNVKYAYAAALVAWSLAGAAAGLATGFWSLVYLRVLLGIFESANWPAALRVVSRLFAPRERSLANGIFQSGTSVGALVAPPVMIYLSTNYSWRVGFVVVGLAGLLWAAVWLAWFRPPTGALTGAGQDPQMPPEPQTAASLRDILRSRSLWGLIIASSFLNPCLYFYVNWLPTYYVESGQKFGAQLAGLLFTAYLVLDLGYITGGLLAARLARTRSVAEARRRVITMATPLMMAIPVASLLHNAYQVTAVICLATLGLGWFMVNYLAFLQDVSHAKVSTVAGILGSAGSVSGAIFMWLVGVLSKQSGSFALPFVFLSVLPAVALGGIWIATRPEPNLSPDAKSETQPTV